MKVFKIIIIGGVEHNYKVLRRQVVELLGKNLFLRSRVIRRVAITALKINITRLLITVRN